MMDLWITLNGHYYIAAEGFHLEMEDIFKSSVSARQAIQIKRLFNVQHNNSDFYQADEVHPMPIYTNACYKRPAML